MNQYAIEFSDPAGHLIDVTMRIASPLARQTVSMPAWIPGSYMIREFAKNIVRLSAEQSGRSLTATKLNKATWLIDCDARASLTIRYRVYAWDRSVRTNYFDQSRGFINPAALLLRNDAAPNAACEVTAVAPTFAEGASWKCATSMNAKSIDVRGFGVYQSTDYDELIDHPFECAAFDEFTFDAGGVPHRFVISGKHRGDLERLKIDAQKICQVHIDLFGDLQPPFNQYVFQLHVVDEGYGGLEHRASTALIAPRNNLPVKGDPTIGEGYLELLGLISHEYFHAWNVKRIKPAAFTPYDVKEENYTRLLWLFEGFTSYYDELMLVRAGLITENDYLKMIARHITQLMRTPGRATQSVADSSFDAWIKYYRQDENAPNAIVSYYLKGGLIALLLDLKLRSENKGTLDDLMRYLWREHGKTGHGVPEDAFAVFERCTGASLRDFESKYVSGTEEPNWASAFASVGINFETRVSLNSMDRGGPAIGATPEMHWRRFGIVLNDAGDVKLKYVMRDSAAHVAGLCAGDTIIAMDGLKATRTTLAKHLLRYAEGEPMSLHYFRQDELASTTLVVPPQTHDTASLAIEQGASSEKTTARRGWLQTTLA
jgi:predicted metalloprotease with PDZ domain